MLGYQESCECVSLEVDGGYGNQENAAVSHQFIFDRFYLRLFILTVS